VKRTFELKDGRKIVCEAQQVNQGYTDFNKRLQEKLHLPDVPDYGIDGDQNGAEVGFTRDQIVSETSEPFRFIDRKSFAGKVVKVWWPLARQGPVR